MNIETKFDIDDEVVVDSDHAKRGEVGTVQEMCIWVGTKGGHGDGVDCLVQYADGYEHFFNEDDLLTVSEFEEANRLRRHPPRRH